MALKDGSRTKETSTTTGTGTLSLGGATTGHNTFVAEIGTGNTCFYWLFDANGTDWEMGVGTVTDATPDTLARTTVIRSSNANSAINLSAGTHVIVNAPIPGYATGDLNFQDLILKRPEICDYSETVATPSISSGTLTLNLETANVFNVTHNANITTLTISNPPASGKCGSFTLHLTQDATGGRTLTMPASVKWSGGTAATISTTASKRNKFVFDTIDGGTTWDCALVGKNYA
jgi:hypothetical protein